jgi:hypothetical protein
MGEYNVARHDVNLLFSRLIFSGTLRLDAGGGMEAMLFHIPI